MFMDYTKNTFDVYIEKHQRFEGLIYLFRYLEFPISPIV